MTANPERGEVDLVVGDKTYILCLTTNGLRALQKRTGKTYGQLVGSLAILDVEAVTQILWSALERHHKKQFPTPEAVGDLIDLLEDGPLGLSHRFLELDLLNRRPPKVGEEETENPPQAQAGTGVKSTLTLAESA